MKNFFKILVGFSSVCIIFFFILVMILLYSCGKAINNMDKKPLEQKSIQEASIDEKALNDPNYSATDEYLKDKYGDNYEEEMHKSERSYFEGVTSGGVDVVLKEAGYIRKSMNRVKGEDLGEDKDVWVWDYEIPNNNIFLTFSGHNIDEIFSFRITGTYPSSKNFTKSQALALIVEEELVSFINSNYKKTGNFDKKTSNRKVFITGTEFSLTITYETI